MYKLGAYNQNNRMSDLVCDNYPVLLVMSRFGIALGFGDKSMSGKWRTYRNIFGRS